MISPKVLTAAFLINRDWPIQQIKNGDAARIVEAAIMRLSVEEYEDLRTFESSGSFVPAGGTYGRK